jgi:hypothetical protein
MCIGEKENLDPLHTQILTLFSLVNIKYYLLFDLISCFHEKKSHSNFSSNDNNFYQKLAARSNNN